MFILFRIPLVPVFAFGENDLYNQFVAPEGCYLRTLQRLLTSVISFPLFYGRGLLPFRHPIDVVGQSFRCVNLCMLTVTILEILILKSNLVGLPKLLEPSRNYYGRGQLISGRPKYLAYFDIDNLKEWADEWQLKLNVSKCSIVSFGRTIAHNFNYSLSGIPLSRMDTIKDIGVIF